MICSLVIRERVLVFLLQTDDVRGVAFVETRCRTRGPLAEVRGLEVWRVVLLRGAVRPAAADIVTAAVRWSARRVARVKDLAHTDRSVPVEEKVLRKGGVVRCDGPEIRVEIVHSSSVGAAAREQHGARRSAQRLLDIHTAKREARTCTERVVRKQACPNFK